MPGGSIPLGPIGALRWMARFDIGGGNGSAMWSSFLKIDEEREANYEPTHPPARLRFDSTRMRTSCNALGRADRGIRSPVGLAAMCACFLGVMSIASVASGDPAPATTVAPDPPARSGPPSVGPGHLPPSWDLDGWYVWLGPTGAASHVDAEWDSTFGAHLALVRVRERERLGTVGAMVGATRWTERGGGRIWLDGIAGTRILRMVGVS